MEHMKLKMFSTTIQKKLLSIKLKILYLYVGFTLHWELSLTSPFKDVMSLSEISLDHRPMDFWPIWIIKTCLLVANYGSIVVLLATG